MDPLRTTMVVTTDPNGIVVRRNAEDADHVRVGIGGVKLWINGVDRPRLSDPRPFGSYTLADLEAMLDDLEHKRRCLT